MPDYWSRFDSWQAVLTLAPLVAGVIGALLASRWLRHLGKIVVGYSITCIGIGLAPVWLRLASLVPEGPLRPVLVETKVMILVGILTILAVGGRAVHRDAARASQAPSGSGR